jgi:hypothetical protein
MTQTRKAEHFCTQHHQPRSQCSPQDRHVHSVRTSDERMARVQAKAEALGLDRNAGIEAAIDDWLDAPAEDHKEPPAPVAADPDLAATVEHLREQIEQIQERMSPTAPPVTPVFREPAVKP